MDSLLPATGTAKLLDLLDPHIPDDFINEHWQGRPARGSQPNLAPPNFGMCTSWLC